MPDPKMELNPESYDRMIDNVAMKIMSNTDMVYQLCREEAEKSMRLTGFSRSRTQTELQADKNEETNGDWTR